MKKVLLYEDYVLFENGKWFSLKSMRFLKPVLNDKGYERVDICINGVKKRVFTHIKVVENFGDCNGNFLPINAKTLREFGLSIDHKNNNKHCNDRKNLEIVTHKENCRRRNISLKNLKEYFN